MSIPQELVLRDLIREQLLQDPKYKNLKENIFLQEDAINELFGITIPDWVVDVSVGAAQFIGTVGTVLTAGAAFALTAGATIAGLYHYITKESGIDWIGSLFTVLGAFSAGGMGILGRAIKPILKIFQTLFSSIGATSMRVISKIKLMGSAKWTKVKAIGANPAKAIADFYKKWVVPTLNNLKEWILGPEGTHAADTGVFRQSITWLKGQIDTFINHVKTLFNNISTFFVEVASLKRELVRTTSVLSKNVIQPFAEKGVGDILRYSGRNFKVTKHLKNGAIEMIPVNRAGAALTGDSLRQSFEASYG